jgi:hypothetical protein
MSLIHFEIALFCAVPDSRWALGAHRVDALPRSNSNELRKWGTFVSPAGLRTIWLHHDLETFSTRLNALSARVAQHGLILTEDQVRALEKTKKRRNLMGRLRFADGDDACTQNRNILMHSETVPLTKSDGRQEVAFRNCRKNHQFRPTYSRLPTRNCARLQTLLINLSGLAMSCLYIFYRILRRRSL